MAPQPSSPKASLDTLPGEIRSQIFREILRVNNSVVKVTSHRRITRGFMDRGSPDLNTALYTVSRKFAAEAKDAFLDVNTVRVARLDHNLDLPTIRHLELTGELAVLSGDGFYAKLKSFFEGTLTNMPRLRTLTIDTGLLAQNIYASVRSWVRPEKSGMSLTCVGLGVYRVELSRSTKPTVHLKNLGLIAVLQPAARHVRKSNLRLLIEDAWEYNDVDDWTSYYMEERYKSLHVMRLTWWLACHEAWRKSRKSPPLIELNWRARYSMEEHEQSLDDHLTEVKPTNELLADDTRLEDLNVAEHGAEVVEWASELLTVHFAEIDRCLEPTALASIWGERRELTGAALRI